MSTPAGSPPDTILSPVPVETYAEQRVWAAEQLPDEPVGQQADLDLVRYEVVIAVNLDYPFRHAQDLIFLEAVGQNETAALAAANKWLLGAPPAFEATGFVRRASPHDSTCGHGDDGMPLPVLWNIPVPDELPAWAQVRDSVTGLRLGFVGDDACNQRWVPESNRGEYRVMMRKPTRTSAPSGMLVRVQRTTNAPGWS